MLKKCMAVSRNNSYFELGGNGGETEATADPCVNVWTKQ